MASKPWAGELWIGGFLVVGGAAIAGISTVDDGRGTVRTAVIGAGILSVGVGTIVHARRQAAAARCMQCTILLGPDDRWTRCSLCEEPLHVKCTKMHAEVYHPVPGAGPYRTGD